MATILLACGAALLFASVQPAAAERIGGTKKADRLTGTKKADKISGKGGKDRIKGKSGADKLSGGAGNDRLNAVDRAKDRRVNGGPGKDVCKIDAADRSVVRSCERTKVVGTTGGGPGGGGGGGGSGGGAGGGLVVENATGLTCAPNQLPLCPFLIEGSGADALIGTVTGGGGVTVAAGAGVVVTGEDWTATGLYGCTADGFLRITIGSESTDVAIKCVGS